MLQGARGEAAALAMRIIAEMASLTGAARLIDITCAHIDSCLFHGIAGLDFAEKLAAAGGQVAVPATLNVSSLDLLHPDLYRGDEDTRLHARRLMDAYVAMGCKATWTCAPYQLTKRPSFGEHIAWAESNAIVFANSVLGARTDRYGDFIDICAAITGRAPEAGLHLDDNRRGTVLFTFSGVSEALLREDVLYPVLGLLVGTATSGTEVPVIDGLPLGVSEDRLKALGAGAASSGAVALFHAVGSTPEAPDLETALGGREPERVIEVTPEMLKGARDELSSTVDGPLAAVSLGTPHFSVAEFEEFLALLDGRVAEGVDLWVSTGRDVLAEIERRGWLAQIEESGVRLVVDTCTYITPILEPKEGVVMTNSAKWAWYAPGNIGVEVVFGSLRECVRSATLGRVWRDGALFR